MQAPKRARIEETDDDQLRISKSRACTECKKHKIKCARAPGESSCVRCIRQKLKCVVQSQLQKIIEDDSDWKKSANAQILQLQVAVTDLLQTNRLPQLSNYGSAPFANISISPSSQAPHGPSPPEHPTAMTRENSQEPDTEPELVSAPMGSLYEVTKLRNLRSHLQKDPHSSINMLEEDFISRGLVSVGEAEHLFSLFNTTMNQYLWGGTSLVHSDLTSVRRSSSLLCAAILSVAALHVPTTGQNDQFNTCYAEFTALFSRSTLNRYHTLDEIRALAIAAFWLSDLSWKLSGHAVRIATEMNLHQSFQKMMRGHKDQFEKARLWYLLYVCDHHFSIAYGRPPIIHDTPAIINYKFFLESPHAGPGDVRMCIQVALFLILTRVYHSFGSDIEEPLNEQDFPLLRAYDLDINAWRIKSEPISVDSAHVGTYPSKGVVLYYHFARFQLNSLALRSISPNTPLSPERREAANVAIASATAILDTILYEPDIRKAIVGIPLFTHTMVAFGSVFLMKIAWKWKSAILNIDQNQVEDLVQKIINLLSTLPANDKHLSYHIASGLDKMLQRIKQIRTPPVGIIDSGIQNGSHAQVFGTTTQDLDYDTFDIYGFDFDNTWVNFSHKNDLFPDWKVEADPRA